MSDKDIVTAMLELVPCPNFQRRLGSPSLKEWGLGPESVKILEKEVNAFFLAAIFDRRITAEQAWEIPYQLKKRLGHLDVDKIAKMKVDNLAEYIGPKKFGRSLHWNYNVMSSCLLSACQLLLNKYNGFAGNIWGEDKIGKIGTATVKFFRCKQGARKGNNTGQKIFHPKCYRPSFGIERYVIMGCSKEGNKSEDIDV